MRTQNQGNVMEDLITTISHGLLELKEKLDELVSQHHLMLDIEFGDEKYSLQKPDDIEEVREWTQNKEQFLNAFLLDALNVFLRDNQSGRTEDLNYHGWGRVVDFSGHIVRHEDMVSEISPEVYAEVKQAAAEDAEKAR